MTCCPNSSKIIIEFLFVSGSTGPSLMLLIEGCLRNTRALQKYWSNLAKYGTPNGPADPAHADAVDVQWPLYQTESDKHLVLANPIVPSYGLKKEECDFFSSLPVQGEYPHLINI